MANSQLHKTWTPTHAAHLLNRAGFGGTPQQIANLHEAGPEAAVEMLLAPAVSPPKIPWAEPEQVEIFAARAREVRQAGNQADPEAQRMLRREQAQRDRDLQFWWLDWMVASPTPAAEKLTLFWHGHFATSLNKVRNPYLLYLQNLTLRQHAMGAIPELTRAISRDPAMILWLDLQRSGRGKPNENFARELMELFVLGEGNYSEQDVLESARAFTGYRTHPLRGGFQVVQRMHDSGPKSILNEKGDFDGDGVIQILFQQEAAARFLCRKIWRYYVSDPVDEGQVGALARSFRDANYEMRPLLRQIFLSREFYEPANIRSQIKGPVQWLVQLCRQMDSPLPSQVFTLSVLRGLGQILFSPPNVKGWDGGKSWITTDTLARRMETGEALLTPNQRGQGNRRQAERLEVSWQEWVGELSTDPGASPIDRASWRLLQTKLPPEASRTILESLQSEDLRQAHGLALLHAKIAGLPTYQLT